MNKSNETNQTEPNRLKSNESKQNWMKTIRIKQNAINKKENHNLA